MSLKNYSTLSARFSCFAAALAASLVLSAPAHAWVAEAEEGVQLQAITSDARGNAVVAGTLRRVGNESSLYVARYAANGELRWRAEESGGTFRSPAQAGAVTVDSAGDVYVTGAAPTDTPYSRFVVAKYSGSTGVLLWKTPVAPAVAAEPTLDGLGETIRLDNSGNVVVAGYVNASDSPYPVVARLNAGSGSLQWSWTPERATVRALALDSAGNVYAAGMNMLAAKLDAETGAEVWRVDRGATNAQLGAPMMRAIAVDGAGNVVAGGTLRNGLEGTQAFYVAQLRSQTGAIRWERSGQPRPTFETPSELAIDSDGSVYAGGRVGGVPAALRLRGTNGTPRWQRRAWAEDGREDMTVGVTDVLLTAQGFYVGGSDGVERFKVTAFSKTGGVRWSQDLGAGRTVGMAQGPGGQIYVAGRLSPGNGGAARNVIVGLSATRGTRVR